MLFFFGVSVVLHVREGGLIHIEKHRIFGAGEGNREKDRKRERKTERRERES